MAVRPTRAPAPSGPSGVAVSRSRYKDVDSIVLESSTLRAEFLPGAGAKLCSLIYTPAGRELLVQGAGDHYRLASYDGDYVEAGECSGMDDMFPTIDPCFYERYPWAGTRIPDHGEVWSLPWQAEVEERAAGGPAVRFRTHGIRFPYQLARDVHFTGSSSIRFDYTLTNLSPFDFEYLWFIHPMILVEEGVELVLPDEVTHVVTAFSHTSELGKNGAEHEWPIARLAGGKELDLRRIRPPASGTFNKYFVRDRLTTGRCRLRYHKSGFSVQLRFPAEKLPYLAVLPNEMGWHGHHSVMLEAGTSRSDRLDLARLRNEQAVVKGHGSVSWHFELSVAAGAD
jgi:hypothetical protein